VISKKSFGFNANGEQVFYFNGADFTASLEVTSDDPMTITITAWNHKTRSWKEITAKSPAKTVKYVIRQLAPNSEYIISINKRATKMARSDKNGDLLLKEQSSGRTEYSIICPV
jgi:hypothetical protein